MIYTVYNNFIALSCIFMYFIFFNSYDSVMSGLILVVMKGN